MHFRKLKIQGQYRELVSRPKYVPSLLLCGEWLHRAGFHPGQYAHITVKRKKLIIKVLPPDEQR